MIANLAWRHRPAMPSHSSRHVWAAALRGPTVLPLDASDLSCGYFAGVERRLRLYGEKGWRATVAACRSAGHPCAPVSWYPASSSPLYLWPSSPESWSGRTSGPSALPPRRQPPWPATSCRRACSASWRSSAPRMHCCSASLRSPWPWQAAAWSPSAACSR